MIRFEMLIGGKNKEMVNLSTFLKKQILKWCERCYKKWLLSNNMVQSIMEKKEVFKIQLEKLESVLFPTIKTPWGC